MSELRDLCEVNDVVFLQETWLMEEDLPILSKVHPEFYGKGVSAMDLSKGVLVGRPFGGLAILWRKSLGSAAIPVLYDDARIMGLKLVNKSIQILLINVYLPCLSSGSMDDFKYYLSKVDSLVTTSDTCYCMVMGDFNADISSDKHGNIHHLLGKSLTQYCQTEGLTISDFEMLERNTYTFLSSAHHSTSWIDHILSTSMMHDMIEHISVDHGYITSDHFPVTVTIAFDHSAEVPVKKNDILH